MSPLIEASAPSGSSKKDTEVKSGRIDRNQKAFRVNELTFFKVNDGISVGETMTTMERMFH